MRQRLINGAVGVVLGGISSPIPHPLALPLPLDPKNASALFLAFYCVIRHRLFLKEVLLVGEVAEGPIRGDRIIRPKQLILEGNPCQVRLIAVVGYLVAGLHLLIPDILVPLIAEIDTGLLHHFFQLLRRQK